MEYDVFISCKSEDYPLAEKLYYYTTVPLKWTNRSLN